MTLENGEEVGSYNLLIKLAEVYDEDPLPYLIWRAQLKGEYDMHHWLKLVQGMLKRSVMIEPMSNAAEDNAKNEGRE